MDRKRPPKRIGKRLGAGAPKKPGPVGSRKTKPLKKQALKKQALRGPRAQRPGVQGGGARVRKVIQRSLNPYVAEAAQWATQFQSEALDRFGAELDYDLDHIPRLDNLFRNAGEEFDDGMVLRAGFFFGEILRRTYAGRYQWYPLKEALSLEIDGLRTFPIEKVRAILSGRAKEDSGQVGTLEGYVMVLARRLSDLRRSSGA
ncbi:MAG: hypothetical protein ACYS22_15000 [Planctomycetota bacterium]